MITDIYYVIPEIFLSLSLMFLLLLGVFKKNGSSIVYNLSILILIISVPVILNVPSDTEILIFNDSYKIDYLSSYIKILIVISTLFVLLTSSQYLNSIKIYNVEYPILILSSILGMMVMVSSNDLIVFYIGLELQSLALYVLASFNRDNVLSSESGLKYFVLSALSSGLLLYGCSLVYGFSSSTNFSQISFNYDQSAQGIIFGMVFILVGLAFKISAVPFHMWAPDVLPVTP